MVKKLFALSLIWIGGSVVILLLQGCYSASTVQTTEKTSPVKITAKPGASVSIRNAQPIVLSSVGGQNIVVVLQSPAVSGEMSVNVTSGDGSRVLSPLAPMVFPLADEGVYRVPVTLNIEHEGRHYVRLHVRVTNNGQTETRVVSAILQVGEVRARQQKAVPAATSDGIISLPAQERVSPQD